MSTPKQWRLAAANRARALELARACDIPPLTAYLCVARGLVTEENIAAFVDPNPALAVDPMTLPDMSAAAERITRALDNEEHIAVFGDYDTDGVCATALLTRYLEARGGIVTPRLPDRQKEGYGIMPGAVAELHEAGVTLIITVDNGISAYEAAEKAQALGAELIITDHHQPGETLPSALAIVDPKLPDCAAPYRDYCGTGLAFLLCCALEGEESADMLLEEFGDLVALATVGDIVPLTGENRTLVRRGLAVLNTSPCPGLAALKAQVGLADTALTARDAAFRLSPRINAAGRMGSANEALQLLLTESEEEAAELAARLSALNAQRQEAEREILQSAFAALPPETRHAPVLVLAGDDWHEGIIGIAAAKAVEQHGRPAFVLSINGEVAKGSGRSIPGFHIHKALTFCADLLTYYGGHAMAGGLTLPSANIDALRVRLQEYAATLPRMPYPALLCDSPLAAGKLTLDLLDAIELLAPFGCENEQPIFALKGLTLQSVTPMGGDKHLRLRLAAADGELNAVLFSTSSSAFPYVAGDPVDLAVTLSENIYRNARQLSVQVQGIRPATVRPDLLLPALRRYEAFARGEADALTPTDIPDRPLIAQLYKQLQRSPAGYADIQALCLHLRDDGGRACALRLALDILEEAGLVTDAGDGTCALPPVSEKRDLADTPTMQRLGGLTHV
ncbi:MAG: single-stranded-DNA-specific exonuclease RecJ [Oscillospiraceae bacterium]|jgi:single-stranded-DNA-specific exonuclease|nr:single-stranded-DNA-specific exonuclease RecJ [Oscillospiraceae bacterium]